MKIETEVLKFDPRIDIQKLSQNLSDVKKQYLSFLTSGESIQSMIEKLFQNGWLVNFQYLYELIETLVKNKAVLNPTIINYFFQNQTPAQPKKITPDSQKPTLNELEEIISKNPFFRNLPLKLSFLLLENSVFKKMSIDTLICKTGAIDRNMYILIQGQVAVYKTIPKKQFVSLIQPLGLFGESSFLTGSPKSADIIATQNGIVLEIPYNKSVLDNAINQQMATSLVHRFWIQNAISNSDFFKKIPTDCLDALTFAGRTLSFQNDHVLFNQNDKSHSAYLIIQGQIKIIQNKKIISSLNQGQFFGEVSLTMTNGIRSASAISYGQTTVLEIERSQFYKLLSENLFLAKEIQNLAFERLKSDQ